MRYLFLLLISLLSTSVIIAQFSLQKNKWQVITVGGANANPTAEELRNQIHSLEIRKKKNNTYSGDIEFGTLSNKTATSCIIKINKNNISINSKLQEWNGEIIEIAADKMILKLGGLTYNFWLIASSNGSGSSATAATNQIDKFYGNWQEVKRKNSRSNAVLNIGQGDTVYIRMLKDSALYRPGTDYLPMYGSSDFAAPDKLNLAGNDFKVISITDNEMILDNRKTIAVFVKTSASFYWEVNKAIKPVEAVDLSPELLIKDWYVSRIAPSSAAQQPDAITSLSIKQKTSENSFTGNISFGKWAENKYTTEPCTLLFVGNKLSIKAESFTWNGQIYKANGDSISFGREGLFYYFKKQPIVQPALIETGTNIIDLRAASLLNNWQVYKPEASPGFITAETAILRNLHIKKAESAYVYKGEVTFDKHNKSVTKDCTVEFKTDNENRSWISIKAVDGNSWNMELFKADGKEMIFGRYPEAIRYNLNVGN